MFSIDRFTVSVLLVLAISSPVKSQSIGPVGTPLLETTVELSIDEQEQLDEEKKRLFKTGQDKFNNRKYMDALIAFYLYMKAANSSDENYEWAYFFYGVSLEKLGFSHAAVDTFTDIVTEKPNTKIVIYILSYFDMISRKQPFDQELLIAQALNSTDYGFIEDDLSALVHYHQGVYDARSGLADWSNSHFEKIPAGSVYFGHYLYHKAVEAIIRDEIGVAEKTLDQLLALPGLDSKLKDTAHWSSARLLFEHREYKKAIEHYKAIKTPVNEQASFLLERAWNQYGLQNPQRAMGLLYAFDAPNFERYFTPEMFILKSLIYKSLCNYESTLSTVDEFYTRYQKALDAVYDRKAAADPESETLLLLVLNDEVIKRQWRFVRLLENEIELLKEVDDRGLREHLKNIYQLKVEKVAKKIRINVDAEYERLANNLLEYEENINLVRYEAGVDRYQSATLLRYRGHENIRAGAETDRSKVIYPFQGEFWNDEFDDYKVHIADECNNEQEWEVFFE
ncbi:hypothetical protein [Teredinibacter haidensis]|uniref:hypothetical protein n=1 Tax=Teredinibacter haidensis TaxID=2731755 RepID=UPI00163C217C|nr:hypothetical protein [Teredinibacter haidensis]